MVADLDGTLLDPFGHVTVRTKAAAARLRERDIPLVLATSRRLVGAGPIAEALGLDGPLILYDGALVRHHPSGRPLDTDSLLADTAQEVAEIMARHGLRPIAQHANAMSESLLMGPPQDETHDTAYVSLVGSHIQELSLDALCRGKPDPLRMVAFGPFERLSVAAREVAETGCGWQLLPLGNYGTSELTAFSPTASKANAVGALAKRLRISMEEVFAVGDGINDVSLLASVGLGVVMDNGGDEARAVAKAVAPSNDADGAAWAIETYVLGSD